MEIVQEIGAYAGFAAFVGLAVLSALYFSQARDVKRLREWAGRAPERTTEPAEPQRVVARPIARPPVPAQQPARAAATGAAPAVAQGPPPAVADEQPDGPAEDAADGPPAEADGDTGEWSPASDGADGDTGEWSAASGDADGDTRDTGDDTREADEADEDTGEWSAGSGDTDGDRAEADDDTGEWSPEDEHADSGLTDERDIPPATPAASAPRPPQPPRPFPRRPPVAPAGRGDRTAVLPPYADSRPQADGRGSPGRRSRRPLAIAAAALVALALAAGAVTQLTGGDDSTGGGLTTSEPGDDGAAGGGVDPSSVTVAVLNGTLVPGLAATLGDQLDNQGFRLGTVTNNFDQARAESVVLYAPGAEREAQAVGRRLDISQREPVDPSSQSLAGDASVIVVAGADQNQ